MEESSVSTPETRDRLRSLRNKRREIDEYLAKHEDPDGIALALGVHVRTLYKWRDEGCAITTVEDVRKWREANKRSSSQGRTLAEMRADKLSEEH